MHRLIGTASNQVSKLLTFQEVALVSWICCNNYIINNCCNGYIVTVLTYFTRNCCNCYSASKYCNGYAATAF